MLMRKNADSDVSKDSPIGETVSLIRISNLDTVELQQYVVTWHKLSEYRQKNETAAVEKHTIQDLIYY